MHYYTFTYGCKMNTADSERAQQVLEDSGYKKTDEVREADLILVMGCSVRQSAVDRVFGKQSLFGQIRKNREVTTVLSGCVIEEDKKALSQFFDVILSSAELPQLPNRLNLSKREKLNVDDYLDLAPKYTHKHSVFVPIMNGCNKFCTYCVVPYTRGQEVSRNSRHIVDEIKWLIDNGCKEITLLGQNVNSYRDLKHKVDFPTLLEQIDALEGDFWLRFTTSHPYDMSDRLIEVMKNGTHICNQLHLPVQCGDDALLKRMNRHYTVEHYMNRINKVREAMPDIAISTDIIVGFCGETQEQFEKTRKFFLDMHYDMAFLSQYSVRKGTKADELYEDDVPKREKVKREKVLDEILRAHALAYNESQYTNQTVKVLVDSHKKGHCYGKTSEAKPIKFEGGKDLVGQFVSVNVTKIEPFHLYGVIA